MTTLALFPSIRVILGIAVDHLVRGRGHPTELPEDVDSARARRDFVNEMLARNPHAFSSDLDVYLMMAQFPGRF